MKILFVNVVFGAGSTGKICAELAEKYEKEDGCEVKIAYGRETYRPEKYEKYAVRIGTDWDVKFHALKTRLFDQHGLGSKRATRKFLKWVEEFSPDLIWLHNIHGYYMNYELLFDWIKKHPDIQVKWTLHDCWAFTGHCSQFAFAKCEQWKTQCLKCVEKKRYPASNFFSNCKSNYERKKAAFVGVNNMTLITPSKWLANLVKHSFLKEYPVEVHNNTINLEIFNPTPSDFREKYNLQDKTMLLGVSDTWNDRKGFYDLIKLSEMLDDNYVVVLVGLSKTQIEQLPKNIIGIERTNNQKELAQIYTAADIFVNTTYEDTYPTVNLEAQACGTPVITYKTGGSVESVPEQNHIDQGNVELLYDCIVNKYYTTELFDVKR